MFTIVSAVLFTVIVVGCLLTRAWEIKHWNSGVCAKNGLPWERFDVASDNSVGYRAGGEYIWVSWIRDRAATESHQVYYSYRPEDMA